MALENFPLPLLQPTDLFSGTPESPIEICLLGRFSLHKWGQPLNIRVGSKIEKLLSALALCTSYCAARAELLQILWPRQEDALASESLNNLVYQLHKLMGDALGGSSPVLCSGGYCLLNTNAGIVVDTAQFDALVARGEETSHDPSLAMQWYRRALSLYHGDLCVGDDTRALIERERLRARYLTLLAYLADYYFARDDLANTLLYAERLLESDPCREDAHRLVMRAYTCRGERAQALRQYQLCAKLLREEFDAAPERATQELYDLIRLGPPRG